MNGIRASVPGWVLVSGTCMAAACAADAGDASKSGADAGGSPYDVQSTGGDDAGASSGAASSGTTSASSNSSSSSSSTSGTTTSSSSGGGSSTGGTSSSSSSGSSGSSSSSGGTGDGGGCVAACLQGTSCTCASADPGGNGSDIANCQTKFLACYEANDCNPNDSCGSNPDGVCGVNKMGVGSQPQTDAVNVYQCANCDCP